MPIAQRLFYSFFLLLLVSCASTDGRYFESANNSADSSLSGDEGNYKYDAWRLHSEEGLAAINVLLDEADVLISNKAYDAAADKIERVLRIKPDYAPAWSRLSWLALQSNSAKRSVQMAKRSNSLSYADPELQALNWSFIRAASQLLHDEGAYDQAVMKIESLKAF